MDRAGSFKTRMRSPIWQPMHHIDRRPTQLSTAFVSAGRHSEYSRVGAHHAEEPGTQADQVAFRSARLPSIARSASFTDMRLRAAAAVLLAGAGALVRAQVASASTREALHLDLVGTPEDVRFHLVHTTPDQRERGHTLIFVRTAKGLLAALRPTDASVGASARFGWPMTALCRLERASLPTRFMN